MALIMFHQQVADKLDLNVTDYKVLGMIPDEGATAGEVASQTGLSTGMTTTVVDRLERKNYVYRERHPDDRRKVIIKKNLELTFSMMAPIFQSLGAEMERVFSNYSISETKAIIDFLNKTVNVFKKEAAKLNRDVSVK